jgi:site-specific DNA-methyltransferase (adenine-specific)
MSDPWLDRWVSPCGRATLFLGDCREIVPTLPRPDAIVTDPPYGIGQHGGAFRGRKGQNIRVLPNLGWDKQRPAKDVFDMMLDAAPVLVIWGGNYFADYLPPSRGWFYWRKLMGGDFSDGELAWTTLDQALREFTKCPKGQGAEHPTQKPIALMSWCLEQAEVMPGQTVLDPYMGSGTTGVACMRHGARFIGCEIEPAYFDVAKRRITAAAAQPDLLIKETHA